MNLLSSYLFPILDAVSGFTDQGLAYIAIGMCALSMMASAIGEGLIISNAINAMSRNPEMYSKIRSSMILGTALDETTAIYCLLLGILLLFLG